MLRFRILMNCQTFRKGLINNQLIYAIIIADCNFCPNACMVDRFRILKQTESESDHTHSVLTHYVRRAHSNKSGLGSHSRFGLRTTFEGGPFSKTGFSAMMQPWIYFLCSSTNNSKMIFCFKIIAKSYLKI